MGWALRYPESRLAPWLVAAAVLVNGAAYWWFSSQRDLRLAEPVRVMELGPPAATLTLLREMNIPAAGHRRACSTTASQRMRSRKSFRS